MWQQAFLPKKQKSVEKGAVHAEKQRVVESGRMKCGEALLISFESGRKKI